MAKKERIFCYWANPTEPTHCAFCSQPLNAYRWQVYVNGIRRVTCTEKHAHDLKYDWDQSSQLGLPLDDEIPFLEKVENPPLVPPKHEPTIIQPDD